MCENHTSKDHEQIFRELMQQQNIQNKWHTFHTDLYSDERGLLEPILGLYGFGSPAMLISGNKIHIQVTMWESGSS